MFKNHLLSGTVVSLCMSRSHLVSFFLCLFINTAGKETNKRLLATGVKRSGPPFPSFNTESIVQGLKATSIGSG